MQAITKNISWEFTDRKVTAWGGMRMFKEFLDSNAKSGINSLFQKDLARSGPLGTNVR